MSNKRNLGELLYGTYRKTEDARRGVVRAAQLAADGGHNTHGA